MEQSLPESSTLQRSTRQIQSFESDVCGLYCLFYCFHKARGRSLRHIQQHFTSDTRANDSLVYIAVAEIYNL